MIDFVSHSPKLTTEWLTVFHFLFQLNLCVEAQLDYSFMLYVPMLC